MIQDVGAAGVHHVARQRFQDFDEQSRLGFHRGGIGDFLGESWRRLRMRDAKHCVRAEEFEAPNGHDVSATPVPRKNVDSTRLAGFTWARRGHAGIVEIARSLCRESVLN